MKTSLILAKLWYDLSRESLAIETNEFAHVAQLVEHVLGKDGVTGSNPVVGSNKLLRKRVARRNENRWESQNLSAPNHT